MEIRTIRLLIVLVSLVLLRFLIFPPITKYFELKEEKEKYIKLIEDIREQNKNVNFLEEELREMRRKVENIQDFTLPEFEISSIEKKSEKTECLNENLCHTIKSYEMKFPANFEDVVIFFKDSAESKSIVLIKKIEISRSKEMPEVKILVEYTEKIE